MVLCQSAHHILLKPAYHTNDNSLTNDQSTDLLIGDYKTNSFSHDRRSFVRLLSHPDAAPQRTKMAALGGRLVSRGVTVENEQRQCPHVARSHPTDVPRHRQIVRLLTSLTPIVQLLQQPVKNEISTQSQLVIIFIRKENYTNQIGFTPSTILDSWTLWSVRTP